VIADVIFALTDSKNPKGYIKDMRRRDEELSKGWGQKLPPPSQLIQLGGSAMAIPLRFELFGFILKYCREPMLQR
jgi:hypothetical protein